MTRHAPALLALSVTAVAGWTYNVNYDTRAALDRLSGLRAEIAESREALQVLRVEWAHLNAPDRLAELVAAHNDALGLVPLLPEALGIAAAVPYPPRQVPEPPPAMPDPLVAAAPAAPAQAEPAAPGPGAVAAVALAEPERTDAPAPGGSAALPAPLPAPLPTPLPTPALATSAEAVPAALELAIAAALTELGVSHGEVRPSVSRGGPIAIPAGAPGVILAAAPGAPIPVARPAAWSGR